MKTPDLIGKKFGTLTVLKRLSVNRHGEMTWLCQCDCGNTREATSNKLTHGDTISCKECRYKKVASKNYKHGMEPIRLWHVYYHMIGRCENPNTPMYYRYGGRGISVCEEWKESFTSFRAWALNNGYKNGLTIERINNDGNYCPENCRWATVTEQANNRSTNRMVTVNGEEDTLANWARRTGYAYEKARYRLKRGMSGDEVFGQFLKREDSCVLC